VHCERAAELRGLLDARPVTLPQEILNVTDRVQSVSSLAVSPCAQQLLTCNKWVPPRLCCMLWPPPSMEPF
jgi:hypothetical protein